jgi:hypothetical protein
VVQYDIYVTISPDDILLLFFTEELDEVDKEFNEAQSTIDSLRKRLYEPWNPTYQVIIPLAKLFEVKGFQPLVFFFSEFLKHVETAIKIN